MPKIARKLHLGEWSHEAESLKLRMLMMKDFDVWVPLTRHADFFEKNPHITSLHAILSVSLLDFIRITKSNENLWPHQKQTKWEFLFKRLGFKHFRIEKLGHYEINDQRCSLRWVNFHEKASGCPKEIYTRQRTIRLCYWSRQCARIGTIGKRSLWHDSSEDSDSESELSQSDHSDPQSNLSSSSSLPMTADEELEKSHASAAMLDDVDEESIQVEQETEAEGLMFVGSTEAEAADDDEQEEGEAVVLVAEERREGEGEEEEEGEEGEEEEGKSAKRQKLSTVAPSTPLLSPSIGSSFAHEAEATLQRVQEGGKLSRNEQVLLLRLVETCKVENENTTVLEQFKIDRTNFARLRVAVKKDDAIKPRTQRHRAQMCSDIMKVLGVGENTAARLLRSRREIFEGAAKKARLCTHPKIGAEATMELMNSVKSSWSGNFLNYELKCLYYLTFLPVPLGMRSLRTLLAQHGVQLNFASEHQCRQAVEGQILRSSYHRVDLNSGAKKEQQDRS